MRLDAFAPALRQNAIAHDQDLFAAPEVAAQRRLTLAPSRRALLLELVRRGVIGWTPDVVDAVYAGLNAGVQHAFSVYRGDPDGWPDETDYVRAARADIVDAGCAPPYVGVIAERFAVHGTPLGALPGDERAGSVVLFIDSATRHLAPETAEAARRLLSALAPDFGELSTSTSGYELYDLGLWDAAREAAERTAAALRRLGAMTVVTESPEAAYAMVRLYPQLGIELDAHVLHLSLWLAEQPFGDLLSRPVSERATYHDSSRLGRGLGIYDEPRALLARVPALDLREMRYCRCEAIPTGPALGYPYPDAIPAMGTRRLEEAAATGASMVVCASPYSKRNLRAATNVPQLRVVDLLDVLALAMEG
jgi:Fe-S oxidoreductase